MDKPNVVADGAIRSARRSQAIKDIRKILESLDPVDAKRVVAFFELQYDDE